MIDLETMKVTDKGKSGKGLFLFLKKSWINAINGLVVNKLWRSKWNHGSTLFFQAKNYHPCLGVISSNLDFEFLFLLFYFFRAGDFVHDLASILLT